MGTELIRVVVVDDDFMIARVHAKFVDSQQEYEVVGIAHNYTESLALVEAKRPDLLVLDVYLPDRSGIDLLRTIRFQSIPCDVILITAGKEKEIAEEGFRLGIFDYLIKPFDLDHLKQSLGKYWQFRQRLATSQDLDQSIVNDLKKIRSTGVIKQLQTGVDFRTLERIRDCLLKAEGFHTAETVANLAQVSRSTARMYLTYLVGEKQVEEKLQYGTVGRPQRLYRLIV